jgi:glucose/arabinose dehydrogenase
MRKTPQIHRWTWISATFVLLSGVLTVAVNSQPAVAAIGAADFQQVTLAKGVDEVGEPMSLAVLPDRSVVHTARNGTLRRTDAVGGTTVIANIPVYSHDEEGLQGVGVDPNFATNRFIYLYYAPPLNTPPTENAPSTGTAADWAKFAGVNRLSRFTLNADYTVNMASKVDVLDVPANRGICCHVGGDIDFDAAGNLYLSTGDDSNPFDSSGYSPIDERTERNPAYDAQRSSGNTNDLRGKILRIKVNANGTYSVPSGNLFASGIANTRPEIYAMGFRNPFRLSVDKATGVVYVGDYGPDAGGTNSNRGPAGQVEFNRITGPGNYGWPYCTGTNTTTETYNHYDFATGASGAKYDCAGGPTNTSFRNTGVAKLPPAKPAWIRYGGDAGSPPEFGGGSESPMGGPVYRYDASNPSTTKFPQSLDGSFFAGELGRSWIKPIKVNADGSPGAIDNFPWNGKQVMDMAFGPDGALYVLDYGTGYFNGDANSALYRYDWVNGGNRAPTAVARADKTSGQPPLSVNFSSSGSSDPEGGPLTYSWTFGDGGTSTAANPSHTYTTNGTYTATLTVRDQQTLPGSSSITITVGNTAPTVVINSPAPGQLVAFGESVPWSVTVSDPEDGAIDCSKITMRYILGHITKDTTGQQTQHGHPITSQTGCAGLMTLPADGEHDDAANIFPVFDASYTDKGGLTTSAQSLMAPKRRQAEHFSTSSGINLFPKSAAEAGYTVGDIHNGDWIAFDPYRLNNATSFIARVSSGGAGGTLQLRVGSQTGPVIGSATVPVTGSWETFTTVGGTISGVPTGTTSLYLTFAGSASAALFDVDSITFTASASTGVGPVKGLAGKCLDVAGANSANGTQIQLYTCNNSGAQVWTRVGQTFQALGKCLDVAGGATADLTRIQLYACNSTGAQNWEPQTNGTLRNPQSGKCLDVTGNNSADATPVILYTCNGAAPNQQWIMP